MENKPHQTVDWENDATAKKIHETNLRMLQALDDVCQKNGIEYYLAYGCLLGAIRHKGYIPWDNDMDVWLTRENFHKLWECRDQLPRQYYWVLPDGLGKNKYFDSIPHIYNAQTFIDFDPELQEYYSNLLNHLNLDFFLLDYTYSDLRGVWQRFELCVVSGLLNAYRPKKMRSYDAWALKLATMVLTPIGRCLPMKWLLKRYKAISTRYNDRKDTDVCFSSDGITLKQLYPKECFDKIAYVPFETTRMPIPAGYDEILKIRYGKYMEYPPAEEQQFHFWLLPVQPESYIFSEITSQNVRGGGVQP